VGQHNASRRKHEVIKRTPVWGRDSPIFTERTLDEAYYPGLPTTTVNQRNSDQLVSYHYSTDLSPRRENIEAAPTLVVPQLWLWRLGETVISAHGLTQPSDFCKIWQDPTGCNKWHLRLQQPHADVQLGLIIASYIESFGKGYSFEGTNHRPSVLDFFEIRVLDLLSEGTAYIYRNKSSHLDFLMEQNFLSVIFDTRGELDMIRSVLEQQEKILDKLLADRTSNEAVPTTSPSALPTDNRKPADWALVEEARNTLSEYRQRADKIDHDAERVEKAIQDMLNLKRAVASSQDAHSSLILSTAVIGFTVITIVFAPLAFLTALFALKVEGFGELYMKGAGQDGVYDKRKLAGILGESNTTMR
jgi:signal transduction histidine kinase